ncbi:MAG TPA: hypothetical protein VHX39_37350, partial [Acetobacteraceae bacterium]|nr:hypothetical protein [Acetobacteraceae bacterium]
NLVLLADGAIFVGVDSVMPEVMHSVIAHQRLRFRWMRAVDDKNADLPSHADRGWLLQARVPTSGFHSTPQ